MATNCSYCQKQLSIKDSFILKGKPVCKACFLQDVQSKESQIKECPKCYIVYDDYKNKCECGQKLIDLTQAKSMKKKMDKEFYGLILCTIIIGFLIWYLSPFLTGKKEPWDAQSPYYSLSLFMGGFIFGVIRPKKVWLFPIGILIGQILFGIIMVGFYFFAGLIFLVLFSSLSFLGAYVGLGIRKGSHYLTLNTYRKHRS